MRPFGYARAATRREATAALAAQKGAGAYLAGGTTLLDLMKLDVMRPSAVIDIRGLDGDGHCGIHAEGDAIHLGAFATMAAAAEHPAVRDRLPVVRQALLLAASPQIRNMARLGGNVLQRTRCTYFRDVTYAACNKREPGTGCAALDGVNRKHAVLGASDHCIATYAGDFAQALIALDAEVETAGPGKARRLPFAGLHRRPGDRPDLETNLHPGEIITGFVIADRPWYRRSLYLKIRDRQSYDFALAAAAVALDLDGGTIRDARIALGGVATVPWRARAAERALAGRPARDDSYRAAAQAAFADAVPRTHNGFKVTLGEQTVVRALRAAAALELRP
jgi:xanthine dehydrogenase YagS FAD-binding subunit